MAKTPPPPNDEAAMAIMRQALTDAPEMLLSLDAITAFTLVGLLQLVMRHPHLSLRQKAIAGSIAHQLAGALTAATQSRALGQLLDYGFDPDHDRDQDGRPISPKPTTAINLTVLIRQALPQVFGSDERDLLVQFLNRSVIEDQIVELDLEQVIVPKK